MCKVIMFTNFRKVVDNSEVINWIGNKLLETESDGFGYSIMGKNGAYGEKYIGKNVDFETAIGINKELSKFHSMPFVKKTRETFGKPSLSRGGALFHGRISTNVAGLKNTHPINKHGWSLIHNGVVTDHGPKYEMISDNDTEHLVEHLASKDGIESLTKNLTGYYAAGAFDPKGNMYIFRDNIAWLYCTKVEELESFIFATTAKLLEELCAQFGFERSTIELVKSDCYMVFDKSGEMTSFKRIKSRGYGQAESAWMSKSLSYMGDDMPFKEHYDSITDIEQATSPMFKDDMMMGDYEAYRHEIEKGMDASYQVLDFNNKIVPFDEFKKYDETLQDECTIIRPDGTLLTYEDYYTDKLASDYIQGRSEAY